MNVDHKGKKLYLIEASRKEYRTALYYAASVEEAKEEFFDDCRRSVDGDDWSTDHIDMVCEVLDEKADTTTVRWSKPSYEGNPSYKGTYFDDEILRALYAK